MTAEALEQELTFIGLVGMIDPPRPEVQAAILTCQAAGIRPVMITGDHPLTARQIARELHIIAPEDERVLTGADLARMSPQELLDAVKHVSVYARVAPEHKLHIVQALQQRGHVVAMTGDGVNDAPALRQSDIGVAMGITGTDVAKEAAHMVILDDNFSTIVSAVEEGRTIYDNVRKFVKYIVTSNLGEVITMCLSQVFGMPLPMTTLQILWMNLVTDGVPGLALGLEPTEKDAMRRPPFQPGESIFSRGIGRHILMMGPLLGLVAFGVGYWAYTSQHAAWGTMVFMDPHTVPTRPCTGRAFQPRLTLPHWHTVQPAVARCASHHARFAARGGVSACMPGALSDGAVVCCGAQHVPGPQLPGVLGRGTGKVVAAAYGSPRVRRTLCDIGAIHSYEILGTML